MIRNRLFFKEVLTLRKNSKKSNLDYVKEVAKSFLYVEIEKTEFSPMIVIHPFFDSGIVGSTVNKKNEFFNIVENDDDLQYVRLQFKKKIEQCNSVYQVFNLIRKPYRITFFKYVHNELSIDDYSILLSEIWIMSENPNVDMNVSVKTLIKWFKKSDKKILMDEYEYKAYTKLSEEINIFRGVGTKSNPNGISWTTDFNVAKWFAKRWNNGGYIIKAKIRKNSILAYYLRRNEFEIIADINDIVKTGIIEI